MPMIRQQVESDLNALKDILAKCTNPDEVTDSQVADIKAAQEKMMESAQKLFAKMYEAQNPAGWSCRSRPGYGRRIPGRSCRQQCRPDMVMM